MPTNDLESIARTKPFTTHFTTNLSDWSSLNATGTLTGTVFYGLMKLKFRFSATNTQVGFWCKKKNFYTKNNLYSMYKYGGVSMMLWGCFSSEGPGNLVRVHGIMNLMKVP